MSVILARVYVSPEDAENSTMARELALKVAQGTYGHDVSVSRGKINRARGGWDYTIIEGVTE